VGEYFKDNMEGWGKARLFMEFIGEKGEDKAPDPTTADWFAGKYPEKYTAWKTLMRMTHGDKFEDYPVMALWHDDKLPEPVDGEGN